MHARVVVRAWGGKGGGGGTHIYIKTYKHTCTCVHVCVSTYAYICIYVYIYIEGLREREREIECVCVCVHVYVCCARLHKHVVSLFLGMYLSLAHTYRYTCSRTGPLPMGHLHEYTNIFRKILYLNRPIVKNTNKTND